MHKTLLKYLFNKAFGLVDVALDALKASYALLDRSGEFALKELEDSVKRVHELVDQLVDALP